MNRLASIFITIVALATLLACAAPSASTPIPEPTATVVSTATPYPTYTPVPKPTTVPTVTPSPTYTSVPKPTPVPTVALTLQPTATRNLEGKPTPTAQLPTRQNCKSIVEARFPSSDDQYLQTIMLGFINTKAPDSLSKEERDFLVAAGMYRSGGLCPGWGRLHRPAILLRERQWELFMIMNYCYGLVVEQPEPDDVDRCETFLAARPPAQPEIRGQ